VAVKGLLLALFSWTIFYIISPYLLRCKVPTLEVELPEYTGVPGGAATPHGDVCKGETTYDNDECKDESGVLQCTGNEHCLAGAESNEGKYCCTTCGNEDLLIEAAERLLIRPTCYGPCHCAHFVSKMLIDTGCPKEGTFHVNVGAMEGWLINAGWKKVSSPKKGDIAFQGGKHIGIIVENGRTIHSKPMYTPTGKGTPCENKCGQYNDPCPDCEFEEGDPRSKYLNDGCKSNQCVTKEIYPNWTYYYKPPWATGS